MRKFAKFLEQLFYSRYAHPIHDYIWVRQFFLLLFYAGVFFYNPLNTGRKLNVHKTFRKRPGHLVNVLCLMNVLCTFNLCPVSSGKVKKIKKGSLPLASFSSILLNYSYLLLKKPTLIKETIKYLITLNSGAKVTVLLKLRLIGFLNLSQVNISDIYKNLWQRSLVQRDDNTKYKDILN